MLRDPHVAGREHDRRGGRDVEGAGTIAAGAARIEYRAFGRRDRDRIGAHRLGEADELGGTLTLDAETDEQPGDLRLGRFSPHDGRHRRGRFLGREVFLAPKLFDQGWEHDHISRKLRRMRRLL